MSMPGFVFYFRCESCDATSTAYSLFPFHDIFRPDIQLPIWSIPNQCWGHLQLSLSAQQRETLDSSRERLIEFAESLSSPAVTVCVPKLKDGENDRVATTPPPVCPKCQNSCDAIFGYPPEESNTGIHDITIAEFDSAPLNSIEISVRTRHTCALMGIQTIGQLRKQRDNVIQHDRADDSTRAEIDRWLSMGTNTPDAT